MRPRFSLRSLLVVFTLAIVFCVWRDQPRKVANRFVAAVDAQRYAAADALLTNRDEQLVAQFVARDDRNQIGAERLPQSLTEWLSGKCHVAVSLKDFQGLGGDIVIHMQADARGMSLGPVAVPARGVQYDVDSVEATYRR
jgi:hypothetical protein